MIVVFGDQTLVRRETKPRRQRLFKGGDLRVIYIKAVAYFDGRSIRGHVWRRRRQFFFSFFVRHIGQLVK